MTPFSTTLWAVAAPLAQELPDENDYDPGWPLFLVLMGLTIAVVLLLFSFRKQLRKVRFDEPKTEDTDTDTDDDGGPETR